MYGVLHDEAHDAVWRVCTKEQVLAHPHRPSPPQAWHPYIILKKCGFATKKWQTSCHKKYFCIATGIRNYFWFY